MSIIKEIPKLLEKGVIDQVTADRIQSYYQSKSDNSNNRLFLAFGALGAMLVSLGIMLIFAHNWDMLSRSIKLILAFVPLIIGQALCAYTLYFKAESQTWREVSAVILFFAVGAAIALVSQIYHMPGELASYLFTWAILVIPLIYVMRSAISSLFYLIGISWYVLLLGLDRYSTDPLHFWWLLAAVLPFYFILYRTRSNSNAITLHNWLLPIATLFGIIAFITEDLELIGPIYACLLGLLYLIGHSHFYTNFRLARNGFKVVGALGTVVLLLVFSFYWPWKEIIGDQIDFISLEGLVLGLLFLCCIAMLYYNYRKESKFELKPLNLVFLIFLLIFFLGLISPNSAQVAINVLLLVIGALMIKEGGEQNHLGILNFGMLIITALITARFFDTDFSFVFRGLLFVFVGLGFFAVNYWLLNKRKTYAE
jgi:uncharacterized membrane protein